MCVAADCMRAAHQVFNDCDNTVIVRCVRIKNEIGRTAFLEREKNSDQQHRIEINIFFMIRPVQLSLFFHILCVNLCYVCSLPARQHYVCLHGSQNLMEFIRK